MSFQETTSTFRSIPSLAALKSFWKPAHQSLVCLPYSAAITLMAILSPEGAGSGVPEPLEGLPLVAHNSPFDEGCLKAVFSHYGMPYPDYPFHCTLRAARRMLKGLPNYQLHTVSQVCGYDLLNHHHALADAEACAVIALHLL